MDPHLLIAVLFLPMVRGCTEGEYFKNEEVLAIVDNISLSDPSLASSYTIGFSSQGTELRVLRISAAAEDALVPQVKLIGGIHGNEPPSTHVLINFAKYLIESYNSGEPYISWLLKNTRIHILPRLNPDGFNEALEGECQLGPGRHNGNGVDLNRAFPRAVMDTEDPLPHFQPEVESVMHWSDEERFVLGAGLHSGSLVAAYPLDAPLGAKDTLDYTEVHGLEDVLYSSNDSPIPSEQREGEKSATRDDDLFVHLAKTYSNNHIQMRDGLGCHGKDVFPGGIINGAEWYKAYGTMMDYNYLFAGTMDLTLEIFCCKYPNPQLLCHIWEQNKLPLLKYCAESIRGVRGVVTSSGIPLELATVTVLGRDLVVTTNSKGQFFRLLLPGRYFIQFDMVGMKSKVMEVHVLRQDTAYYTWTETYVELEPEVDSSEIGSQTEPEGGQANSDVTGSQNQSDVIGTVGLEPRIHSLPPRTSVELPQETAATSVFDDGGLDPSIVDGSLYPLDSGELVANESSIFTQKSIYGSASLPKLQQLVLLLPLALMAV